MLNPRHRNVSGRSQWSSCPYFSGINELEATLQSVVLGLEQHQNLLEGTVRGGLLGPPQGLWFSRPGVVPENVHF